MLRISWVALVVTFAPFAAAQQAVAPPAPTSPTPPNGRPAPTLSNPASTQGPATGDGAPSTDASRAAPTTPGATSAPAAPAKSGAGTAAAPAAPTPNKSGIVLVEQAGRVAALGVVLNGDGRIVTALSRVTPGQLFVRYENGTLEAARIGHSDPARDLALLVPRTARWQKGLAATRAGLSSPTSSVVAFSLGANRTLKASTQSLAGSAELGGHRILKLSSAPKPNELGGPLLDPQGDAVGIVVSGCGGSTGTCSETPVALPVNEVRAFLRSRPPTSGYALPHLGIAGVATDTGVVRGLAITSIVPKSPASTLGLRAGDDPSGADVLVAVAGAPVPSEDALRGELARHAAGDRVELLVFAKDRYRITAARLAAPLNESAPGPAPVPK